MTRTVKISEFAKDKTISDLKQYLMTRDKWMRAKQTDELRNRHYQRGTINRQRDRNHA